MAAVTTHVDCNQNPQLTFISTVADDGFHTAGSQIQGTTQSSLFAVAVLGARRNKTTARRFLLEIHGYTIQVGGTAACHGVGQVPVHLVVWILNC